MKNINNPNDEWYRLVYIYLHARLEEKLGKSGSAYRKELLSINRVQIRYGITPYDKEMIDFIKDPLSNPFSRLTQIPTIELLKDYGNYYDDLLRRICISGLYFFVENIPSDNWVDVFPYAPTQNPLARYLQNLLNTPSIQITGSSVSILGEKFVTPRYFIRLIDTLDSYFPKMGEIPQDKLLNVIMFNYNSLREGCLEK